MRSSILFFDRRESSDAATSGWRVKNIDELEEKLRSALGRPPHCVELIDKNGQALLLGLGPQRCFAQFTRVPTMPPFQVATSGYTGAEDYEFSMGDTPTPIAADLTIDADTALAIAYHFVNTGEPLPDIEWREI